MTPIDVIDDLPIYLFPRSFPHKKFCQRGGEPDIIATAKRVLNDFQRGKLPYFALGEIFEGEETSIEDEQGDEEVLENEQKEEEMEDDEDASFDLAPHSEDELEETQKAAEEEVEAAGGLSKSRQRQLERALR
ncbi:unnamed protein product, partial [Dibothriocephalus latus]